MKNSIKNMFSLALLAGLLAAFFTGCTETNYYHHYHHHTHDWYGRHHQPVPAGVDFNVDVEGHR